MIRSNQGTVSIDGTVREALCDFACVVVELNRLIGERETREMFDYAIELDPGVWRQDKPMLEKMEYEELVKMVEECKYRMTRCEIMAGLIGYFGSIDKQDFDNVRRLFDEGLID